MTLPLSPKELRFYNNVPTTPLTQKLGDTINELVAGNAYQVADMTARNALTPEDKQVVRVETTGELFVWDASTTQWRVIPYSSTRPDFFIKNLTSGSVGIFCDPAGDDLNGEGTSASPFASVSRALDSIPHGFVSSVVVVVAGGTYDDRVWNFSATPGSLASYAQGTSTTEPIIRIVGQGHLNGEVINVTAANTTANNIPHPSGAGSYASIKQFNFPTWATPIPGPLPTMFPVTVAGAEPEYLLIREAFTTVSGEQISYPTFDNFVVAPGSDNTTGSMHLVSVFNLFSTGNYRLARVDQLPTFPNLRDVIVNSDIFTFSIIGCGFGYTLGGNKSIPELRNVTSLTACFLDGGGGAALISTKNFATSMQGCYIRRNPANPFSGGYFWVPANFRGGWNNCYFRDLTVNVSQGQYYNVGGVYDTSPTARPKIVFGTDDISTSHGAGPHVGVSYLGGIDMIGGGLGLQLVSTSVRVSGGSGNLTFDGVSNPLNLTSHSFWGYLSGTAIGTCTAPVVIGPMSMTGSGFTTSPTGVGISGWSGLVTNTAAAGSEVQVGANAVTTFGSLPETDFAQGNLSIGAVGK